MTGLSGAWAVPAVRAAVAEVTGRPTLDSMSAEELDAAWRALRAAEREVLVAALRWEVQTAGPVTTPMHRADARKAAAGLRAAVQHYYAATDDQLRTHGITPAGER